MVVVTVAGVVVIAVTGADLLLTVLTQRAAER